MKIPFKVLWLKAAASTSEKGMRLLEKKYEVIPTFAEETADFIEALEQGEFDFILVQLPLSDLYKGVIKKVLKDAFVKTPCMVIEISTNRDKIDWIKAGAKEGILAEEIELLPILLERQMTASTQQAATEQALKQKEAEYVSLFHNSLEAILIHDYNKITQVNAAFLFQLGYLNGEELIGRRPLETIVHPEDIALLNLTEGANPLETVVIIPNIRLLKKDASLLKCDLRITSMCCEGAWGAQIVLQEITNKKSIKAYLEAKEQNQMLLHYAEQVPGMIYQFQGFPDKSYCFPFVSNSVYKTHGITAQELMEDGSRYFEYMPEEDKVRFMKAGAVSSETFENWNLDYRLVIPGRGVRWMRGTSTPVRLPDGSILWSGYIADITADKIASAALKDREEQVRTIFKHAPDAIVVLKTDGTIVEWNPKAVAIFGWTEEEAVGVPLYQLIGPARNCQKYEESVESYKNGGDGIALNQALEIRAVRKSGEEFSITMALSEMTLKDTQFFIGFISDITKRKNAAEKLKESLLEKEVLLKEIHHRVKNNMQVITSLLSLQSSFIEEDAVKEIFRTSQYRINSMGMVHEMLYQSEDISKINYGSYLKHLIERLIRAMRGENSLIQLTLEVPNVSLNIDTAIPLGLIVNELVTNSLKYAFPNEQNGTICVKLSCLEYPNFQLDIGDDGIGFFGEDILKTTKSLGLMLVGRLSMQLKGSIQHLETEKGTHYVLLFQELSQY